MGVAAIALCTSKSNNVSETTEQTIGKQTSNVEENEKAIPFDSKPCQACYANWMEKRTILFRTLLCGMTEVHHEGLPELVNTVIYYHYGGELPHIAEVSHDLWLQYIGSWYEEKTTCLDWKGWKKERVRSNCDVFNLDCDSAPKRWKCHQNNSYQFSFRILTGVQIAIGVVTIGKFDRNMEVYSHQFHCYHYRWGVLKNGKHVIQKPPLIVGDVVTMNIHFGKKGKYPYTVWLEWMRNEECKKREYLEITNKIISVEVRSKCKNGNVVGNCQRNVKLIGFRVLPNETNKFTMIA